MDPANAEYHGNLGAVLARQNRLPEAGAGFRLAAALDPVAPSWHANLGTACLQQGRPTEAEICFRQALLLRPDDAELHRHLSDVLFVLKRLDRVDSG